VNPPVAQAALARRVWRIGLLVAAALVFALAFARLAVQAPVPGFLTDPRTAPAAAASPEAPRYRSVDVSHGKTPFAHSAAAVEVPGHGLLAFWYAGSREGASDSVLYQSAFDAAAGRWSDERIVIDRVTLESALQRSIRKIGNPTVARDREGRLWLFFVSASIGGWAGSAVNFMRSQDGGRSWSAPRRLATSPFLNISTLVKGSPVLYEDGSIGLPVYHELLGKFGELLRIDSNGRVLAKQRLAWGNHSLQPVILPRSAHEAAGFMRYAGDPPARVLAFRTVDGGRTWSAPEKSELPNPNAGIDVLRLDASRLLIAFNNREASRDNLSLAHSGDDGRSWRVVHAVEEAGAGSNAEYSYPWLLGTQDGGFHLFYTVDKQRIRQVSFNRAWLEEKLR
jgi:predicted neuraminidase